MEFINNIQEMKLLLADSDHSDVKTIEGQVSLREFIACMLSYEPWWLRLLYQVRGVLVRMLGLEKQPGHEEFSRLRPEDVSLTPGENASFFTVRFAKDEEYWIGETPEDKHLRAYVGIAVEPLKSDIKRFHVITIVKYKHWTGPVYFNLIRPFHHLVVNRMIHAGVCK